MIPDKTNNNIFPFITLVVSDCKVKRNESNSVTPFTDIFNHFNENNDRQTGYSGLPVIISLLTNGGWRNQTTFFLQKMLLSLSEMTPKIASPKMLEFILEVPS